MAVQVGGPSGQMIGPAGLRPDDLLRRPGHRRRDHGLRPGPRPARDRRARSWSSSSTRAAATARPAGSATCLLQERLGPDPRRPRRAGRPRRI
ncbi:MAG: hypothetical protein MZU79_06540 [Anaerotruncus sp.]|nr:hypothetical protein [Anaerotruncus sp.]